MIRRRIAIHPDSLTADEIAAMTREIDFLTPYTGTDDEWRKAALEGECFCAGRFVCTKHMFQEAP